MRRLGVAVPLTLALLVAAGALAHSPRAVRDMPLAAPLQSALSAPDGWTLDLDHGRDVLPADPRAGQHIAWALRNASRVAWIAVDYYPSQREGNRPPAQELLYPGQGWTEIQAHPVSVPLAAAGTPALPATLVLMRLRDRHIAVLYWYQLQRRAIASDHGYRAVILYNRLIHGRSDGALVRVGTPVPEGTTPAAAIAALMPIVRPLYQGLLRTLPD